MEVWRNIKGFEGYQISDAGRVRSFWRRKHRPKGYGCDWVLGDKPKIMSMSDDGNGYMKVMLTSRENGRRYCRKIHKLVAEAFIPKPCSDTDVDYTVDHIKSGPEGKLDNSVSNLRWLSRGDNIRKAYKDGMCDERIRASWKDIIVTDIWTGEEVYFSSIKEASEELGLNHTSISHALKSKNQKLSHYIFEYAEREERLLYGNKDYKLLSWLRFGLR